MSIPYVISDLHINHKNILKMSPCRGGTTVEEHNDWIVDRINSVVTKRDILYILGDVSFDVEGFKWVKKIRGQKNLVRGNHDRNSLKLYLEHFNNIYGLLKYKGMWFSHAPIHPGSLRGSINIHGHTHDKVVMTNDGHADWRYINVCVEQCEGYPVPMKEILEYKRMLLGEI